MIRFKCLSCGGALEAPASLVGADEKCPACGTQNTVPAPAPPRTLRRPWQFGVLAGILATACVVAFFIGNSFYRTDTANPSGPQASSRPPRPGIPAPGKIALEAMKKLQARIEIGLSYAEYRAKLGETWADVKPFVESGDSMQFPSFRTCILAAFHEFEAALKLWTMRIDYPTLIRPQDYEADLQASWKLAGQKLEEATSIAEGRVRES